MVLQKRIWLTFILGIVLNCNPQRYCWWNNVSSVSVITSYSLTMFIMSTLALCGNKHIHWLVSSCNGIASYNSIFQQRQKHIFDCLEAFANATQHSIHVVCRVFFFFYAAIYHYSVYMLRVCTVSRECVFCAALCLWVIFNVLCVFHCAYVRAHAPFNVYHCIQSTVRVCEFECL